MSFEAVIGLEIHAQLLTETKIFCGCRTAFGARAEHARLSGLPRAAGRAAGAQPARGRVRRSAPALALDCAVQPDVGLRAQELLLSRPAEGLPDLAVRSAARDRRLARGRATAARARRHHARPPGRGRRQVAPSRLPGFRPRDLPRLQPQRRAAHRDRHRAGPAVGGRCGRVLRAAARDPRRARRQRRQHGRGQPALRRQRVGAAGRQRRRSARRPKSRTSTRSGSCRRRSSSRSSGRSASLDGGGRVRQETRLWDSDTRRDRRRCAARKRRTTIATFRSPICRRSSSTPAWVDAIRAALPELPEARKARFVAALRPERVRRRRARAADPGRRRLLRGRRSRAGAPAKAASNWIQGEVRRKLKEPGADDVAARRRFTPDGAGRAGRARRARRRQQLRRQGGRSRRCGRSGDRAGAIVERGRPRADRRRRRRSPALVAEVVGRNPDAGGAVPRREDRDVRVPRRAGHEGQRGKANPKVVNELLRRGTGG